jgi:hypothetical protein
MLACERAGDGEPLPYLYGGSEVVEFSPSTELRQTLEVVERNMASLDG